MTSILGLSAFYHDSAAAILRDGELVAAVQEERFSRRKNDARLPVESIRHCLQEAGIGVSQLDAVVFYDKPFLKFERLIESHLAEAPRHFDGFRAAMPIWLKEKLYCKRLLRTALSEIGQIETRMLPPLLFSEHHRAHAASAFYPSPYPVAAVLCIDGVGEWATLSGWLGEGNGLTPLWEQHFPHSLGLLYSAITAHCGFEVNFGEYKLMGLAPYGAPRYLQTLRDKVIDLKPDGSFQLDLELFDYMAGLQMTAPRFETLFGPARQPDQPITQQHKDLAASIQALTEQVVLKLATTLQRQTVARHLCLAGGVALNCVANGRLLREGLFEGIWIQPAAGDAGGAVGAAYDAWHRHFAASRSPSADAMRGARLGPAWSDDAIADALDEVGASYERLDEEAITARTASSLAQGEVVGWYQGRMEFGPRALGGRSILADPRRPEMQARINHAVKKRESFRPFAPMVLANRTGDWFEFDQASSFMQFTAQVRAEQAIPAVTHVDGSARLQTVAPDAEPRLVRLLETFATQTGCPLLLNTSFNVRDEPIVRTPRDAYRCFIATDIDRLVIGNLWLDRSSQAPQALEAPVTQAVDHRPIRLWSYKVAVTIAAGLGVIAPWLWQVGYPLWPWPLAFLIAATGHASPSRFVPVHAAAQRLGQRIGVVITWLLLALIYYLAVTPLGWFMCRLGYDPLLRKRDDRESLFAAADDKRGVESMRQPF